MTGISRQFLQHDEFPVSVAERHFDDPFVVFLTAGERQVVVQPGRRGASRAGGFPDRLDLRWIFFSVIGILVLTLVIFIARNFSKIGEEGPDE